MADHFKLTADDRLALICAKIHRAKHHLADLEIEANKFVDQYRNARFGNKDLHTGEVNGPYEMRKVAVISPDMLLIAGDAIHNVRTALDHLIFHLALVGTPGVDPGRVQFPIAKDACSYEACKATQVMGVDPLAVKFIDGIKPYHGGEEAFWRIHELDIIDKHRMILTVERDVILEADWMPTGSYMLKTGDPHFSGLQMSDVEKDIHFRSSESFGDPEILKRNALVPTIKELIYFADTKIREFRPYLQPKI